MTQPPVSAPPTAPATAGTPAGRPSPPTAEPPPPLTVAATPAGPAAPPQPHAAGHPPTAHAAAQPPAAHQTGHPATPHQTGHPATPHQTGHPATPHQAGHALTPHEVEAAADLLARLGATVAGVVLGKPAVVRLALTALLAEGHLLIEDVPGVGKTTLARAIAASVRGQWRRIQFTPDLLPSDVTGVTIFNQATRAFEFHPGPVFANLVIADEINRASPKTQSALLEVMEEQHVTVDGVRNAVPRPFLVVATQNPVEMDGTYRLPEAQLDRFLMRLSIGYPTESVEVEVLRGAATRLDPDALPPVTDTGTIAALIRLAQRVHVADPLYTYAVRLAVATRTHRQVRVGVSPRGAIALTRAAAAFALTDGRGYVLPEDLKALAEPVFAHRLLLAPDAQVRGLAPGTVVAEVLASVPAPAPA